LLLRLLVASLEASGVVVAPCLLCVAGTLVDDGEVGWVPFAAAEREGCDVL
jgi:hypothetical protein